jgi:DNA-binding transcriptional regulator YhcF (GntR family)
VTPERSALDGIEELTWEDVAKILRERIETGDIEAGRALPTQASLVDEFGVTRATIRQALGRLQQEGLLTEVTRGAPPRVAERSARGEAADGTPRETMAALGPRVTEAFAATEVRIDALCLTAESLTAVLGEQRRLLHERRVAPSTVKVRVLLPAKNIELAFPRPVGGPDESGPDASGPGANGPDESRPDEGGLVHKRWLQQRNAHLLVLSDHLMGLKSAHGTAVDVQFKALPFTPPVKLYLLNGSEALFAYYRVTQREEEIDRTSVEMYDALGIESPLFSFGAGEEASRRDKAFVSQSQAWFDALWETIATDLEFR